MCIDIYQLAADVLNISRDQAIQFSKKVERANAMYIWDPTRGGISVFISPNGEKLAATSSVRYEDHLKAFLEGKRN